MTIPEGERYLPKDSLPEHAFNEVILWHGKIGSSLEHVKRMPWEMVGRAANDFFTAGVAYLANRSTNPYLEEVGTTAWRAVNRKIALVGLTDDIVSAEIQLGVPRDVALHDSVPIGEPRVIFRDQKVGKTIIGAVFVLMPTEFLVKACTKPVEALTTMAWISSQLRDLANGRLAIDGQNLTRRAMATEAEFLLEVKNGNANVELSRTCENILKMYPKGMASLPAEMRYTGNPPMSLN